MIDICEGVSPLLLCFTIAAFGCLIGKIRVFGVTLDIAGVLLAAMCIGYLLKWGTGEVIESLTELERLAKLLTSVGSPIFVSAIALSAGYSLRKKRGVWKSALVGVCMTLSAIGIAAVMATGNKLDGRILLGALCGALTSTPGLAVLCDASMDTANSATLGYSNTYIFSVMLTVLFVQLISGNRGQPFEMTEGKDKTGDPLWSLLQICIVIVLGSLFGDVIIPGLQVSLGGTGGILFSGLLIGKIIAGKFQRLQAEPLFLSSLKHFGLMLFFVGTGIPAGFNMANGLSLLSMGYGIGLTIAALFTGYLLCRFVFRIPESTIPFVIAGGITSSPALGVLSRKNARNEAGTYAVAYVTALITTVVGLRLLSVVIIR